jgi:hypothetical protein
LSFSPAIRDSLVFGGLAALSSGKVMLGWIKELRI